MPTPVQRIVSLVPSQTELLHHLGLDAEVVGITKFCVHPEAWFRSKTRVGGTKNVNIGKVRELNPTLIIANREENVQAQVEQLALEFETYVSNVCDLASAFDMIRTIGQLTQKVDAALNLVHTIDKGFGQLEPKTKLRAVYAIWNNPLMVAGCDTFIHDMMAHAGFENCMTEPRYPQIDLEKLCKLSPDVVLLSSEPFPFKAKHVKAFQRVLPKSKVVLVDGELFSWYGSRMLEAPEYFNGLKLKLDQ